jgi:hypothetical protein
MNTTFHPDKPFWIKYLRSIYGVPRAWALKGENLVNAFEAVPAASVSDSPQFNIQAQALMLAGMAIEVELKALLVNEVQIRELVSYIRQPANPSETSLLKVFYGHNLAKLAEAANLHLTPERTRVAEALSSYIYWRGRYIMPRESGIDDIIPIENDNGLVEPPNQSVSFAEAQDLIKLVIAEVKIRLYGRA